MAYTDHEIGRVIQEIEDKGKLDNTHAVAGWRQARRQYAESFCSS
jgi:hypothetical protein